MRRSDLPCLPFVGCSSWGNASVLSPGKTVVRWKAGLMVKDHFLIVKRSLHLGDLGTFLVYFLTVNSVEVQGSLHQGKDYIRMGVAVKIHVLGRKASLWSQDSSYKLAVTVNNNLSPLLELRLDFKSVKSYSLRTCFVVHYLLSGVWLFGTPGLQYLNWSQLKSYFHTNSKSLLLEVVGRCVRGDEHSPVSRHGPLVSSAFVKLRHGEMKKETSVYF